MLFISTYWKLMTYKWGRLCQPKLDTEIWREENLTLASNYVSYDKWCTYQYLPHYLSPNETYVLYFINIYRVCFRNTVWFKSD